MTKLQKDRELVRRCIEEKWALLVANPEMEEPEPECPLCTEYDSEATRDCLEKQCVECPIRAKTGEQKCKGTPYNQWIHGSNAKAARAECDFLWALYDELTARERDEYASRGPICGDCEGRLTDVEFLSGERSCKACRETKALAEKLDGKNVTMEMGADEMQKLYAPVSREQIAGAVRDEHGVDVEPGAFAPESVIRTLGVFDVPVRIGKDARATVKLWVVEGEDDPKAKRDPTRTGECVVCGARTCMHAPRDGAWVCDACRRECYDADGRYLVPVTRGGPWEFNGEWWERWVDGEIGSQLRDGYRVVDGSVCSGDDLVRHCSARPGVVLKAPVEYTGPLPEGCRWADGSEPKPYKVLEGSCDGKTWFEITRTDAMDAYLSTDTRLLHSTRVRTVDASGKTTWTDETCHVPPKAAHDIRPNDRVFVNKISDALNGERGIVITAQKAINCYRIAFDDDTVRNYRAGDLRLERAAPPKPDRITTRAAVVSLGRIVSDIALTLKREEFQSTKAEGAFASYEHQAERLLARMAE